MNSENRSPLGNDPATVRRVAEAIYKVQVDSARKLVAETTFDLEEMKRVAGVATTESDRAAAILLFSYAEDVMLKGIRGNVNHDVKGGFDGLVSPNGLLATASDRITFLATLRWIDKSTYASLNLLRGIRNKFAHHVACDSLSERSIAGMITSMPAFERPIIEQTTMKPFDQRQTFLARALLTVYRVMHETCILPHALAHQVDPRDVSGGYDDGPANLRELGLTVADCILMLRDDHQQPPV